MSEPSQTIAPPMWFGGEPAPWFIAASNVNPRFNMSALGGMYVAMCLIGDASTDEARTALRTAFEAKERLSAARTAFLAVSTRPEQREALQAEFGSLLLFWDHDLAISRLYGAATPDATAAEPGFYSPCWIVLDPHLRTLVRRPLAQTGLIFEFLKNLPPVARHGQFEGLAPVLVLPRIFEPDFCRALIQLYEQGVSMASGFMRQVDGKTVGALDDSFKRRRDHIIVDPEFQAGIRTRIGKRLLPEIRKAFNFNATRIERYIVACYDSESGGFFRPHRDNTTPGTRHRRFAVTINLNEEYAGGDLRFPEYSERPYRAPTGGAVVFSCSLLHEATPVTEGRRYASLPFLYDDASAETRRANAGTIIPVEDPQASAAPDPAATASEHMEAGDEVSPA